MRKYLILFCLLFPATANAQTVPLVVAGDVKTEKITKQITVQVDVTVVNSLPFVVSAQPGAALYFWTVPPALTFQDQGNQINVTDGPNGNYTVSVKVVTIDWDKKVFITSFGTSNFYVGEPGPPVDPFTATVQQAYIIDGKPAAISAMLAIYKNSASVVNDTKYNTAKDVQDAMHTAIENVVPSPQLKATRQAIATELVKTLGTTNFNLTADTRAKILAQYVRVTQALTTLSPAKARKVTVD